MRGDFKVFRRRALLVFGVLLVLKFFSLGLMTATEKSPVSPAPVYAQEATSPDEVNRADEAPSPQNIRPGGIDLEIIQDVEKRQKELDSREAELNRREERLNALQKDLDRQISELRAVQAKIEEQIALRKDIEDQAVNRLAKTYASMPPESAAELIQQIDRAIAIRVLGAMKERSAGRILAAVPPNVASSLSEGLVKRK